ncbi:helix-turn-helix transcriptional regulator [Aquimarina sp. U1-2]|uniref:helix-turn-helix domain-containing protein n=1 Tax=Aquimarina sp. U1-2 TaxID=2823141 RepID=UPI001AECA532|nr:helix-turn-helix transcriptional regulator [Aquimarina sp. U1-2]MBP2831682.1 helix-turn-helix transcriptional regulator [Aquimarina sp. U1-2]
MILIEVKSLPIKEVITNIAKAFKTTYQQSCGEYFLDLPEHIGEGNIRGINFDGGMGIIQYDCTFVEEVEFHFTINKVHPLKFLYCLEGYLKHRFEGYDDEHEITQYQEAIVASDLFNGHILCFKPNIRTVINSLEITRREFQKKIQCELVSMNGELRSLFNDIEAKNLFYHDGFYSLKLADLFRDMQAFEGGDFLKKLFLEGKAYQMLTEQILQYEDDLNDVSGRNILRRTEIKQIELAAKLIRKRISKLDNVAEIASEVGLNANKLQEGFQNLYGTSVKQYIKQVRLNLIKDLVLNTEYSMSEIVDLAGISSKSYLAKIFREEYGTAPSDYRRHFMDLWLKKHNSNS